MTVLVRASVVIQFFLDSHFCVYTFYRCYKVPELKFAGYVSFVIYRAHQIIDKQINT